MTRMFMKKDWCLLVLIMFLPLCHLFAQTRQVTGQVLSSDNKQPLQGASVTVKGTTTGVTTNAQGRFTITVPANTGTLLISNAGFTPYDVNIEGKSDVSVSLAPEIRAIEDVVVIGYQTVRRKDLLASVSSIGAKDLKDIPINSAAEALNGRLAGVTATTAEGSPDSDIRVRIRGGMSITGDNSPLYVIDGVQMENALSVVSPQDIQSIDVLKDAAATAIYGARGANGVIVITTKSGRPGKFRLGYNGFVGVKYLPKKLRVLDPYDYVIYQSERSRGSNTDSTSFLEDFGTTWDTLDVYKSIDAVDWQGEVFGNTGITTTHNITGSGGSQTVTYNFGYTFNDEKAIVINSKYRRHLMNAKIDYKIAKNVKLGVSGRYTIQDVYGAGVSDTRGSSYNRLRNAVKYRPYLSEGQDLDDIDPIADPNVGNGLNLINPILLANSEYRKKSTQAYMVNATLSVNIIKNLTFKSTFGYDNNEYVDRQFSDSITPYSIINGAAKPVVGLDTVVRKTITNSNVLTYSIKDFKKKHDFDILVGEETYDLRTKGDYNLFRNYPTFTSYDDAFKNTDMAIPFTGYPKVNETRYTSLSFFGRINYSFMDKYLMSANLRADGASKFRPGKQWGTFPSVSVAWRIKNEKFMKGVDFINDMKVRIGYGEIGNNRINDYLFLTSFRNDGAYFYGVNNEAILAYYSGGLVNQDLQWESTVNRNLGFDITLFDRRIDLVVDVYRNSSKDLLLNVPVASTFGYSRQLQNVGETLNKGVEVQLNAAIMRKASGFTWNANFNISFNRNEIVKLGLGQTSFLADPSWGVSGQPADYIQRIGDPVGSMWGLVTAGFYTVNDFNYNVNTGAYTLRPGVPSNASIIGPVQPGSIKFSDINGDGVVDINNDRTIIGDPTPKCTGGLSQQFTYKAWDASLFVNFAFGNDIYNANKIEMTNGYSANSNILAIMENRWRVITPSGQTAQFVNNNIVYGLPPDQLAALNANATIWQPLRSAGAFYPHSWAIEDGSFLRFNNLTVGYTFPAKSVRSLKMEKLRLYVTANNFAIITNYSGYDPEVSVRSSPLTPGLDYSAYPKSSSFIFGVNASF
ncbi:MAG TPA: TonB-dependent receptor [Chitinophagaceae bacterium]